MSPTDPQPPKRNFDERIDALDLNMELHATMMREVDPKLAKLDEKTYLRLEIPGDKVDKLAVTGTQFFGVVQMLAGIAQSHARRLDSRKSGRAA